jgi:lipopolysaccharide transport system ATP-binding protein
MTAVQQLCTRCVLLDGGRVAAMGDTGDVVMRYLANGGSEASPTRWVDLSAVRRSGSGVAQFTAMRYASPVSAADFRAYAGGPLEIDVRAHATTPVPRATLGFTLRDQYGATLLSGSSTASGQSVRLEAGASDWSFRIGMLPLRPGTYQLDLWLSDPLTTHDRLQPAIQLEVIDRDVRRQAPRYDPRHDGPVFCEYVFAPGLRVTEVPEHGVKVAQTPIPTFDA